MNENIIAIDGPAGSGKSSVAKEVASKIGFNYLDTGSYYRAITLFFIRIYKNSNSSLNFSNWFQSFPYQLEFPNIEISTQFTEGLNKTFLNKEDVSEEIRLPAVTEEIKHLAGLIEIRDFVNERLRILGEKHRLIMDGRDIGTEVFPSAKFKFFLTASIEVRAQRRFEELAAKGIQVNIKELQEDIRKRDESDTNRKIAPLKIAEDAILIDTSELSKNVVITMILSKVSDAMKL